MTIDPRLNDIDDCLYRVAAKAMVVQDNKVLLVKEVPDNYWSFPGGGVDHGESVEAALLREVEEELGVPADKVVSDFNIAYFKIDAVVNSIPRMNLYYRASVPKELIGSTKHVSERQWFTRDEFMTLHMSPSSNDRAELAQVIFGH